MKYQDNWLVVQACKEPYHRQAIGYSGRSCAKEHPEYLFARRQNKLILNLVDVDNPDWASPIIVDETIKFIDDGLNNAYNVLIHCNQGMSRSATIGLLYLKVVHAINDDFAEAEKEYLQIYPWYNPGNGMRMFAAKNWINY